MILCPSNWAKLARTWTMFLLAADPFLPCPDFCFGNIGKGAYDSRLGIVSLMHGYIVGIWVSRRTGFSIATLDVLHVVYRI